MAIDSPSISMYSIDCGMKNFSSFAFLVFSVVFTCPFGARAETSEFVVTPGVMEFFGGAFEYDRLSLDGTPKALSDGKSVVFERKLFKITFNDREITVLHVPMLENIMGFSDFLYDEPYKKHIAEKLQSGTQITDGELEVLNLAYETQIEALRAFVSLGYQACQFHQCINGTAFGTDWCGDEAKFSDGTIFKDSIQRFFDDEENPWFKSMMAWGRTYVGHKDRDYLQNIIAQEDSGAARDISWNAMNVRYAVRLHMGDYHRRASVPRAETGTGIRYSEWNRLQAEALRRIGRLWDLASTTAAWSKKAPPSTFKNRFEQKQNLYHERNRDVVRHAREIFFDFPLAIACVEYRKAADGFGGDNPKALEAIRTFSSDISRDVMLKNIKSAYCGTLYSETFGEAKKSYVNKWFTTFRRTVEDRTIAFEDKILELGMMCLDEDSSKKMKSSSGDFIWKENGLIPLDNLETQRILQARRAEAKSKEELEKIEAERRHSEELARIAMEERRMADEARRKAEKEEAERQKKAEKEEKDRDQAERLAKFNAQREKDRQEEDRKHEKEMADKQAAEAAREREAAEAKAARDHARAMEALEKERQTNEAKERKEEAERRRLEQEIEAKEAGVNTGWFSRILGSDERKAADSASREPAESAETAEETP